VRARYSFSVFVLHFSPQFEPYVTLFSTAKQMPLTEMRRPFLTLSPLETLLVPVASHFSVFALSWRKERNFRLFVFNHLQTFLHSFSLFARE
jgi:hypothetical protein